MSNSDSAAAGTPARQTKLFVIYDERAMSMDTDDAAVLCCAKSQREA